MLRCSASACRSGWGVTNTARVRIRDGDAIREGSGAGHGIDADLGLAHESDLKEAETDAIKRALMPLGSPFGLALYGKQLREVTGGSGGARKGPAAAAQPPSLLMMPPSLIRPQAETTSNTEPPAAPSQPDPGLVPLDPAVIDQLLATLRSLPRPALEGFTKTFRKRFQVPADAPSIADRIFQQRHHDWIEAFLVSHREVR